MQSEMCLVQTTVKSTQELLLQFHTDLLLRISIIQILLNPVVKITWTGKYYKITESQLKS